MPTGCQFVTSTQSEIRRDVQGPPEGDRKMPRLVSHGIEHIRVSINICKKGYLLRGIT